jgi:putative ABC transport system permease protein
MRRIRACLSRLGDVFNRRRTDRDLAAELESHLQFHIDDNLRVGMSAEEARRQALIQLGGLDQTKEAYRDRLGLCWPGALWIDFRYVLRQLERSPGFCFIVLLVLAVGFGVSIAIFSAVRTVLLAPLPYKDATSLVQIVSRWPKSGDENSWSAPFRDALDWKATVPAFQDVAMYRYSLMNLTGDSGSAESLYGLRVTANLWPTLGVRPQLGEWFSSDYDHPGNDHVVLLSDDLWHRRFHADPAIVGKTIAFNRESYEVLGVMPKDFNFPLRLGTTALLPTDQMQYWTPLSADVANERRGEPNAGVIAKLKDGVSIAEAQMQIQAACLQLQQEFPASNKDLSARLYSLRQQTISQVNVPLLTLLAAAGLILLMACANVAGLLLARGEFHASELAVRMALGGTAWRVARVPIIQGILLCVGGGLFGIPCAILSLRLLLRLAPIDVPRLAGAKIDLYALAFAALAVVLTGLFVGAMNAMQVLNRSPREVLSEAGRTTPGRSRARLRSSLVIGQVALTVVLMSAGGLMLRTFISLLSTDIGYSPDHALYAVTVLPPSPYGYPTSGDRDLFYRKVLDRLRAVPGVQFAGVATGFPLVGQYDEAKVQAVGTDNGDKGSGVTADVDAVSPGYLEAVGVRLIRGRLIHEEDAANTPKTAVIDTGLANALWPGQDPIGKLFNADDPAKPVWRQVVGVLAPMRNRSLDIAGRPGVFLPLSQTSGYVNFVVTKSSGTPDETVRLLKGVVSGIDPNQGVFFAQSMSELIRDSIATRRFLFVALAFFGVAALVLAVLGVYGLVSFVAARRVREVGIRMALGATRGSVVRLIVFQGAQLVLFGAVVGLCASVLLDRLLSGLLFGVAPFDVETLGLTIVTMAIGTIVAALVPAYRAARFPPIHALRTE